MPSGQGGGGGNGQVTGPPPLRYGWCQPPFAEPSRLEGLVVQEIFSGLSGNDLDVKKKLPDFALVCVRLVRCTPK